MLIWACDVFPGGHWGRQLPGDCFWRYSGRYSQDPPPAQCSQDFLHAFNSTPSKARGNACSFPGHRGILPWRQRGPSEEFYSGKKSSGNVCSVRWAETGGMRSVRGSFRSWGEWWEMRGRRVRKVMTANSGKIHGIGWLCGLCFGGGGGGFKGFESEFRGK